MSTIELNFVGKDAGASKVAAQLADELGKTRTVTGELTREQRELTQTQVAAASQIRAYDTAIALLQRDIDQTKEGTREWYSLMRQQQGLFDQAAAAANRYSVAMDKAGKEAAQAGQQTTSSFKRAYDTMNGFLAANVISGLVGQVSSFASESFKMNAALDQNARSLGVILGSQQRANEVMAQGTAFGKKYGFTVTEMSNSLAGMSQILKNSKAPIEAQLSALARLSTLNPGEGIQGATFALKELISGDVLSLVERFNISKKAAYEMRDAIAAGADPVKVLDDALNGMGVTSEALASRMEGPQGALVRMQQASEEAHLALGQFLDAVGTDTALSTFASVIADASKGLQVVADNIERVGATSTTLAGFHGQVISGAQSFDQYQQGLAKINEQIPWYMSSINELTPSQYAFAQSLIQSGASASEALSKTYAMSGMFESLAAAQAEATEQSEAEGQALADLESKMIALATASPALHDQMVALSDQYTEGETNIYAVTERVNQLTQSQDELALMMQRTASAQSTLTQMTDEATNATAANNDALVEKLTKTLDAEIKTIDLTNAEALLASASDGVSQGMYTTQQAAATLAEQLGITAEQAEVLIGKYIEMSQLQNNPLELAKKAALGATASVAKTAQETSKAMERTYKRASASGRSHARSTVSTAEQTHSKQADLLDRLNEEQENAAKKTRQIEQDLAADLLSMDKDLTRRKMQARTDMERDFRRANADASVDMSENDIDLIGATGAELEALKAREAAEQAYLERQRQSQEEARKIAEGGDAELAQKIYEERMAAAQKQLELDQEVAKKRNEIMENGELTPEQRAEALAQLEKHQQEQTERIKVAEDEQARIAIEEAQQEAAAEQEKVDKAIAAAQQEKEAVMAASAEKVAAIEEDMRKAGVAIGGGTTAANTYAQALRDIPSEVKTTITQNYKTTGTPAGGSTAPGAPSGGTDPNAPGRASGGPVGKGGLFEIFDTPRKEMLLFPKVPGGFVLNPNKTVEYQRGQGGNTTINVPITMTGGGDPSAAKTIQRLVRAAVMQALDESAAKAGKRGRI